MCPLGGNLREKQKIREKEEEEDDEKEEEEEEEEEAEEDTKQERAAREQRNKCKPRIEQRQHLPIRHAGRPADSAFGCC